MGQRARYRCKKCNNEVISEFPISESQQQFADKVPCTRCGNVGCNWAGSA